MRLSRIRVDGFGTLRDASYELNGPITIVYGRNEAGKSTMMNFLRYILFGFPARGAGHRFEPVRGGAHGGALTLTDAAGRAWRVERHEGSVKGGGAGLGKAGAARLTADDGTIGTESLLHAMLGGMNGELYRSLFGFGLDELQELRTLQADEVASYLYGAGFGAGGAAIREAERRLQQRMDELYRPRGRNQPIAVTVKAIDDLDAALRRSREELPRYDALRRELAALDEAIAQLASRSVEVRERGDRLAQCLKARPTWLALHELEREWAGLPAFPAFPEAAVSRWETLAAEREAFFAQRERLLLRRSRLTERLGGNDAAPADAAPGREALLLLLQQRLPLCEQGEREALQLEGERRQLQQRLAGLLRTIDPSWDAATLRAAAVTVAARETVRAHRERQAALAQERGRLQAELEQALQRHMDVGDEVRQAAAELEAWRRRSESSYPWPLALDTDAVVDEQPDQLLRAIRRDYDEWRRVAAEAAHLHERAEDERRHLEQLQRQRSGPSARANVAVPLTLLAVGVGLGGWLLAFGQRAAAVVAFAVLAAIAAVLARPVQPQRGLAPAAPHLGERLAALAAETEQLQRRLLDLLQRLTAPQETAASLEPLAAEAASYRAAPPRHTAVTAAVWEQARVWLEQSLAEWEQLAAAWLREREHGLRRRDRLGEQQAVAARAAELRRQAEHRLEALGERLAPELEEWRAWLAAMRLPAHLSPDTALETLQRMEQGHALLDQIEALGAKLTVIAAERAAFDAEVGQRLELLSGEKPPAALRRWKQEDERLQQLRAEWERTVAELAAVEEELEELEIPLTRLEERVKELLAAASANDEQQLRINARLHERRRRLEEERRSANATLEAWVGDNPLERLDALLSGKETHALERELQEQQQQLADMEQEEAQLRDHRGRVAGELDKLEASTEHADRLQHRKELEAQLEKQAAEWTELALAVALFRRTRELYERDKQPFVLQRASALFAHMTEGRYERVIAPLGEQRLLAMRPDGETIDPGRLSRGTAEQLYLSMRFAIAAEYTKEAPPPLLFDDILVNFDEGRVRRTLELLGDLAQTHHVLLFTCHPHIVQAAEFLLPQAERLNLE